MTTVPFQSSWEKATPVSRSQRNASKVTKPPACPQTMTCRSFREASARVKQWEVSLGGRVNTDCFPGAADRDDTIS
jgi:hypothetical protein